MGRVLGHPYGFVDRIAKLIPFELGITLEKALPTGAVALVLGAEGAGMRQLTGKTCDELVRLPMKGAVESLNVSVACGILLAEAWRSSERGASR